MKTATLLAAAILSVPLSALAFGDASTFTFTVLQHGGGGEGHPGGLKRIAWELAKRTSIQVALEPKRMAATDPDLFKSPFLVLSGDADFPAFSDAEREALRRHLTFGGFLLIDDASAQPGGPFDRAARRELAALFPTTPVTRLGKDHVLFKSFYLLEAPWGRVEGSREIDGVVLQGRLAVAISPNDLQGATAKDQFGNWELDVPAGDQQRENAVRFGINLVMYALCLDYKDDQVHVPFIMKRRR